MQDAFTEAFSLTLDADAATRNERLRASARLLHEWCAASPDQAARALRQALIFAGLDQWGLAWSQAFGAGGLAGLSELVGHFRDHLDPAAEAACQAAFAQVNDAENAAFTFKAELRRAIHLALWHALIAETDRSAAENLVGQLGGQMLALDRNMPHTGWLILAGTLADIRIRSAEHDLAQEGLAQEMTQALTAALARELPPERRQTIWAAAAQAAQAWRATQTNEPSGKN